MKLRLSEYRKRASMTQADAAKVAGVSARTEWSWEQGKLVPDAAQLCALCEAFGCSPNDLLGWYDEHPRSQPSLSADERALVSNYRASDAAGRETVSHAAMMACGEGQETASSLSEREAV